MASSSAESSRRGAKRQRQNNRNHHDDSWVFDVHSDLVEEIFTHLPIRQCVQIGMVAKEFRGTWRKCRNLDFGRDFAATQPHRLAYSAAVDHAIESHHKEGKIKTLQLCFDPSDVEFLLEKWVRKSVKKGVEELDLDIFQATVSFCVPTNAEEAKLKELKLYYSVIHMLFNLKALVSLTTLVLRQVDLTDLIIEVVFKNCVHLETFDMADCYGVRNMKVKANNRFKVLMVGDTGFLLLCKVFDETTRGALTFG
ncbi:putative FBD-associated F-box protein At1g61330 [Rosa rugosa]|uniref:putative FBD-associated F-box protein At1g61330 n=1 Tax=Rosa rugosa TaxID=74645 RepID=UPI002B40F038|nr:putative FBD-associated F-box protein At1g61330 [Rosa rugosa]